jgi:hypothetical protein
MKQASARSQIIAAAVLYVLTALILGVAISEPSIGEILVWAAVISFPGLAGFLFVAAFLIVAKRRGFSGKE